jgi:hypothetical protein
VVPVCLARTRKPAWRSAIQQTTNWLSWHLNFGTTGRIAFSFGLFGCWIPGCFPLNYLESFTGIAWSEDFSFTLDTARVNGPVATDSDGNLPRVIAHSQGSREK